MKSTTSNDAEHDRRTSSRARLVDAAIELFSRQGFDATSVGEIEIAAGFAPRSGALYQYFDSKRALLDAGLERHLASVDDVGEQLEVRPLGDVGEEITLLARWLLDELDRDRQITHLLEREGERLTHLRERAREGISERGYRIGSALVARWLPNTTAIERDVFAVATIGALINFRRSTWTFGAPPCNLTDEEFITGWVELFRPHINLIEEETRLDNSET